MKKFWIVMLAVAMLMAFTAPVIASVGGVDVQFSGTYRVRGWYDDNISLLKNTPDGLGSDSVTRGQAFYDNRLRLETTFKIAEGLKLVTRFDALEKKWGQDSYSTSQGGTNSANISFERAYVSFTTGLGTLNVGYQDWSRFGTQFIDSDETFPGIKYINSFGPLTVLAGVQKRSESRATSSTTTGTNQPYGSGYMDIDSDMYIAGFIFKFKGGDAGLLYEYLNDRSNSQYTSQSTSPYRTSAHIFDAYGKFKAGIVYVEAEGYLMTGGMYKDYTKLSTSKNVSLETYGFYINAEVDLKPFYAGAKWVYVQGDDGSTADKREGGMNAALNLGQDHDFALMLGNYEYFNQVTASNVAGGFGWTPNGAVGTVSPIKNVGYGLDNIVAWQIYVGVKPTPKLDVRLAVTDANCQTKPYQTGYEWNSSHIGTEVDLRASYKIFDNLTYSIGAGYFFTGDYFKGYNLSGGQNEVANDYLLMHQLLLSF